MSCFYCLPKARQWSWQPSVKTNGQTVDVPVYSDSYSDDRERAFDLSVPLSIRNTDPTVTLELAAVDNYDSHARLVKQYLESPQALGPMGSTRSVVKEPDSNGGSGANFVVIWHADRVDNPPIIESVMIGSQSQQGISFTSRGQVISE